MDLNYGFVCVHKRPRTGQEEPDQAGDRQGHVKRDDTYSHGTAKLAVIKYRAAYNKLLMTQAKLSTELEANRRIRREIRASKHHVKPQRNLLPYHLIPQTPVPPQPLGPETSTLNTNPKTTTHAKPHPAINAAKHPNGLHRPYNKKKYVPKVNLHQYNIITKLSNTFRPAAQTNNSNSHKPTQVINISTEDRQTVEVLHTFTFEDTNAQTQENPSPTRYKTQKHLQTLIISLQNSELLTTTPLYSSDIFFEALTAIHEDPPFTHTPASKQQPNTGSTRKDDTASDSYSSSTESGSEAEAEMGKKSKTTNLDMETSQPKVPRIEDPNITITGSYRHIKICLLYTSPSPRDRQKSRMPSSA